MFGRRSHARYSVRAETDGLLRVLTDVAVSSVTGDELVVVSREPAMVGDVLFVHLPDDDASVRARVEDSRPVVVEGAVRHRVRLTVVSAVAPDAGEPTQP